MLENDRRKIDALDKKIVEFLNKRAKIALHIGKLKSKTDSNFFFPEREKEVLANIIKISDGPLTDDSLKDIYSEILNGCRQLQKVLKIAYFGPEATYTHQAAMKTFGRTAAYITCQTIPEVFEEVEKQRADYGVVPVENSNEGMVFHTLDTFKDSELKIVMEINMPIHHYILSKACSLEQIKKVYYHPQAYFQCQGWLKKNLPHAELVEASSTAESARLCGHDEKACSISSQVASKIYDLNILAGPVEDYKQNVTRFLVIGNQLTVNSGNDKTSIMFSIKDRIGALHDMLLPFKHNHINLTKIESRPTKQKAWNYIFYVDFLGHVNTPKIKKALEQLEKNCSFLKILGSYPRAEN